MSADPYDLIVMGAGPAGASAAIAAADAGLRVLLVDENAAAGGQVYRAPNWGKGSDTGPDGAIGDDLRERLAASKVELRLGYRVWFVEKGFRVCAITRDHSSEWRSRHLVVAGGAQERHRPIPGWTLPGVIGLAGATNLLKAQRMLPGKRCVVAGAGPLLLLVAATILKSGGEVAALIDANSRLEWAKAVPSLLGRLDLIARGASWYGSLLRAGVPVLHGHVLNRIEGADQVEAACATSLSGTRPAIRFACDSVCHGFGLMPATDVARLLGIRHRFDAARGGWHPIVGEDGSTDVPGLFFCGDGAGVLGAAAAALQGRNVGNAVARAAGASADPVDVPSGAIRRAGRFGSAMTALASPPEATLSLITPDTIVCRCESLSRHDIDAAIAAGSHTINSLKATTRCGMGPCGGRICEDTAASLICAATGHSRETVGQASGRPPLRPVPLAAISGEFDYFALPMPEPAPQ